MALSLFLVALIFALNEEFDLYGIVIMLFALPALLTCLVAYRGAKPKTVTG